MDYSTFVTVANAGDVVFAFKMSDIVGRTIVIFLFFGSIFTWTIMLEKWIALTRAKQAAKEFLRLFRNEKNSLGLISHAERLGGPLAKVYKSGVSDLLEFYDISKEKAERTREMDLRKLSTVEIETIRSSMERSVADQILQIEDKIGYLATAVSVCPFFGLFGTVWGVMVAFCGMASNARADISAIAPGVSGALLTTVVGLLVAIPSLIGYNLLTNTIRQLTVSMDNFVEEFMARIKLDR
ncbi:MAG: biopolymer transporter ExbB [Kiritimatiellaeota bacterium]|nr:biopolymer transporter ExbB [Kiritimatiellota bacterium]